MSTILLKTIAFILRFPTWRGAQRVGAVMGLLWFYIVRVRRGVVLANLSMALPEKEAEKQSIARNAYRHFGMSFFELMKLGTLPRQALVDNVITVGMSHFEAARARGKGVIVVTAHYGNFDLLAYAEAVMGIPLAIISRNLRGRGANRFWMETRAKSGLAIFSDTGDARRILKWLKNGKVLGITVDQRLSKEKGGILSEFMGWRVWTTTAPAALALASGAALLPVRVERLDDGRHRIVVEPEIRCPDGVKHPKEYLTRAINQVVARWICHRPEQWMWLHRRFVGAEPKPELE